MTVKMKAVVIDDAPFCQQFMVEMLEDRGYEVTKYSEPVSFINHCKATDSCPETEPCVDLLLTDNYMPNMTGLEFLQRQMDRGCKLDVKKLAVISGSWTSDQRKKAEQIGCEAFEKPFLNGLNSWLDRLPD